MNQDLILQAQQRKVQIKNNSTVERLREVLKAVWPKDEAYAKITEVDMSNFYFDDRELNGWYYSTNPQPDLPIINVTDFFKATFTWGQEVIWRNKHPHRFVAINPVLANQAIIVNDYGTMANCDLDSLSPYPSVITKEEAALDMLEILSQLQHAVCLPDQTRDTIKRLLNRIQPK